MYQVDICIIKLFKLMTLKPTMTNGYLKGSNFREFAKISSRELWQGQSFAKINSREKKFWNCQIRANTFFDRDIGPNEDVLVQNVWLQ